MFVCRGKKYLLESTVRSQLIVLHKSLNRIGETSVRVERIKVLPSICCLHSSKPICLFIFSSLCRNSLVSSFFLVVVVVVMGNAQLHSMQTHLSNTNVNSNFWLLFSPFKNLFRFPFGREREISVFAHDSANICHNGNAEGAICRKSSLC